MSDNDLSVNAGPVDDAPLSVSQGDEALANLLSGDLGTDLVAEEHEQKPNVETPDGDDDEVVIDNEDILGEDAPEETEFKGGRFASDDAKVKLEDGTTISIAELKRNNLFQRDYSKKTEDLAVQKKGVDEKDRQLAELSNAIENQRRFIDAWAKKNVPRPPDPQLLQTDPYKYMQDQAEYTQRFQEYQHFYQSMEQERVARGNMSAKEAQDRLASEFEKLKIHVPVLKTNEGIRQWAEETEAMAGEIYGLEPKELNNGMSDHRFMRVLHDALKWQRAVAKKAQAKPATQATPRIPPQQRMSTQTPQQRDSSNAFERLRQTGSARDGEAALMKFIT